ncbi:MAG: HAMP domain-containing protein [Anaerolineae bacterium]|nr:HAMP domain-containing protein [Anaerolineae bacterium]
MFRSLRLRLLLAMALVVALALSTVALFASRATSNEFQRYVEHGGLVRFRRLQAYLATYYDRQGRWDGVQPLVEQMAQLGGDRVILTDPEGLVVADSAGTLSGQWLQRMPPEPPGLIVLGGRPVGAVFLRPPDNPENGNRESSFLTSVNRSLLVSVAVTGSAAVLLALGLSRRILRPVEALTQAARAVGEGDLSRRVAVTSDDEIGELARAFNSMAESLARLEQARRNLVTDVAHELRTPLSNLRAYLEGMCDGVIEPSPEAIVSIHEEALLLSKLVDDLQELSLAEAGAMKLYRRPLALPETVSKALAAFREQAATKGISLATDLPPNLPLVNADPDRVGQVLRNLLSNAVAHTPGGGHVSLIARVSGTEVQVTVQDDGVGIPEEHLPHIFDRFYRADDSRTRTTGGSGLGLAIVQQLVQAHGGRVWVESTEGEGSLFHFTLPVAEGDAETG